MGPLAALGLLLCVRLCGGEGGGRQRGPRRCRARLSALGAAGSGELRLVGGGGRCAGRVEVKHRGEWGSVCVFDFDWDSGWPVVCRQLGCGRVSTGDVPPAFPMMCPHFSWGEHFCGHGWDVGVTCTGEGTRWPCEPPGLFWHQRRAQPCGCPGADAVELRLAGGGSPCAGRVEDAEVVCQQLGCGSAAGGHEGGPGGVPGAGLRRGLPSLGAWVGGAMLEGGFQCNGSEPLLSACAQRAPHGQGCSGPASVICSRKCRGQRGHRVRLAGGRGRCRGFLEVLHNGTWDRVCVEGTNPTTAATVCRQLGCGDEGHVRAVFAQHRPQEFLAMLGCKEGSRSLWECPSAPWQVRACKSRVPSRSTPAVAVGTVAVPAVLCVVLGTLLCLALGALAVLLCRARARRRGESRWVGAGTEPLWGSRPGNGSEGGHGWPRCPHGAQGSG
uniref:SRCR domain-containing protein n=1 Tax=Malurus cyaneus samueli TaxID=2593467 RepID=A0A8C5T112_9PASS